MDIMARNLDRVLLSSEAIDSTTAENVKLNNEVISAVMPVSIFSLKIDFLVV